MKKILLGILILGAALVLTPTGNRLAVKEAPCWGCYSGECYYSSICGDKCTCMKQGLDVSGVCVSF